MATIWVDLDNAPHVVTFKPIVEELRSRGHTVFLTARNVNRTAQMARTFGLDVVVSGGSFGASRQAKVIGTLWNAIRLAKIGRSFRADLAVSHGSRRQAIAAAILGMRSAVLFDYERADLTVFRMVSSWHFYPDLLDSAVADDLGIPLGRRKPYPGLKEHLALLTARTLTASDLREAGVPCDRPFAVLRPESDVAHYLPPGPMDDSLLERCMQLCHRWNLFCLLVPRDEKQEQRLRRRFGGKPNVGFLRHVVNGISLLRKASLLISGGGTMNREAAVLGIPCVSIFRGPLGVIDRSLIASGRIRHVQNADSLAKLSWEDVGRQAVAESEAKARAIYVRDWIVNALISLAGEVADRKSRRHW